MNKIKLLRIERNLSQEELAKHIHVTQAAVSQWEKEKSNLDLKVTQELATFFEVTVDYLLGRTDERNMLVKQNTENGNNYAQIANTINNGSVFLSKMEADIIRIFRSLDGREQTQVMTYFYDLESKNKTETETDKQ